ncbi:eukaryotic translation initiation factor 3 subunit G-like [Argopecten irradians]|uniref:eukaryotic translation initiation factor 3 subunit G-like n=1 Tax=Argopecten irradians TaxID=31199 RepID=UPI00371B8249
MPSIEEPKSFSWAEQVEQGEDGALPPSSEDIDEAKGIKIITDFKYNDEGKMVKMVKTFKIEHRRVPKTVAKRKNWRKFGAAENDPPGPNSANTIVQVEEIPMQFVHNEEVMKLYVTSYRDGEQSEFPQTLSPDRHPDMLPKFKICDIPRATDTTRKYMWSSPQGGL